MAGRPHGLGHRGATVDGGSPELRCWPSLTELTSAPRGAGGGHSAQGSGRKPARQ